MDSNIYYSINDVLSYNALFNFIIGERGVGKTYSAKKYVTSHYLKKHKEFVYLRRYKSEIKKAMGKTGENKFFEQILNEFPEHKLTNNSDTMYIDDKIAGYAIPLSVANILKSASFENVDTIIFDEFIIDKGNYHYLQNEIEQLLDIVETISRLRDVRVIFLGNAISITNPYFTYFDLTLPYGSTVKTFKDGLILVNYIKNEKYRDIKKKTRFGQLIKDTSYGKYAIDNEMLRDSKSFIAKKTGNAKFYFILFINGNNYGVWLDYSTQFMYISNDIDPNCPIKFSINPDDHDYDTMLIRVRSNPYFKNIIDYYRAARLCFENQKVKNTIMNIMSKYLTY
ncbi:MAG: phage DNA encapsidation protein [Bacilli bacterium]|nr:phage DNA encapsidation protein [Bacilli bacterium]